MSNQNDNYFTQTGYILREMQFQLPSFFMLPFKMSKKHGCARGQLQIVESFVFLMIPFQAYFNTGNLLC